MPQFTPVFLLDKDQFIVCTNDFLGESAADAVKIGLGASLVECILWGAKFIHKTIDITEGVMGIETTLEGTPVAIIAGPLMEASTRMDD